MPKLGLSDIDAVYLGGSVLDKIYLGSSAVYTATTPPSPWTPADLGADLALWLDADDTSTLTVAGSNVVQWNDKSVAGNNVSQSTASAQPSYALNNLNNKPGITSTGYTIRLDSLSNIAWNFDIGSFATVCKFSSADNYEMLFQLTSPTEGGSIDFFFFRRNESLNAIDFNASPFDVGELSAEAAVYTGRYERNIARNTSVNGTVFTGTPSVTFTGQVANARFTILGPSLGFVGSLNELVVCKNYLSDADRQKLEGYLAHKWGLTANLPSDHPYKTVTP